MALTRDEKTEQINQLTDTLDRAKSVIFSEYHGMTMKDSYNLRTKLREAGIDYKVIKTTLLTISLKKKNIQVPQEVLDKPLAVAFGFEDEVTPAKLIVSSAKELEPLKVLGGIVEGKFADASQVKQLALLPGREELYAKLVGSLASPMSGLVNVLQGNIKGLVSVLKQHQEKIS
jgi:large subunit ribosomal protein L10